MEGLLLDYLHDSHELLLRQRFHEFSNVEHLLLIIILLIPLLLAVVVITRFLYLRDLPRYPVNAFLNVIETVLKLQLACLLHMEEELIIELVDHAECLLIIGELLEVFEDEHYPILEGVNRMDVLLVLGLDLQEGVHEAHPLQVLGEGGITEVPTESLQDVLDLLPLLALALRQLAETESGLVHSHFTLPQILHRILSRHYRLREKLLIQVL